VPDAAVKRRAPDHLSSSGHHADAGGETESSEADGKEQSSFANFPLHPVGCLKV